MSILDDPVEEMESCLSQALDRLTVACRDACNNHLPDLKPVPYLSFDYEMLCDPAMGNTAKYYEDYLREVKECFATLLPEFKMCAMAARRYDAFDECRLASDILIGSDDNNSDDFSDYYDDFDEHTLGPPVCTNLMRIDSLNCTAKS